jgi:hypothetical protein
MSDADEAETLERVDALLESLQTADAPYWTANDVMSAASDALVTSLTACDLYHLWSRLTDWYELKPDDRAAAVAAMRRAATEWPAVKDDPAARDALFQELVGGHQSASTRRGRALVVPRRAASPEHQGRTVRRRLPRLIKEKLRGDSRCRVATPESNA